MVTGSGSYVSATAITQSGSAGNYTLTASVAGGEGILPTGNVSFLDTNNSNYVQGTAALGAITGTPAFGVVNSSTPSTYAYPQAAAVADFNGDGKADLAIPDYDATSAVTILLGNGNGTFTAAPAVPITGANAGSVAVGDFNGDGKADLAITLPDNNEVAVLLGNGDGTFTAAPIISDPDGPFFVTVGDFNGDGIEDLAVVNPAGLNLSILLGNGDGTFRLASNPAAGSGLDPVAAAVGDFNGDGKLDIAVADYSPNTGVPGSVTILLGNGDGTFTQAPVSPVTGDSPLSIAVADFNGDGKADLAVANSYVDVAQPGSVTILLGNGDGTFTPAAASPATGSLPYSVAVGDFNGDGKADLATANSGSNTATVLLGNGDGTFTLADSPTTGTDPVFGAVGDFNGDGLSDLATANNSVGTATILLSQIVETAATSVTGISPVGTGTHQVKASYAGDTNYAASESATTGLTAEPATTALSLNANPATSSFGQQVVLTATLSPYLAQDHSATGTVTFFNGTTSLGAATLSSGVATLNVIALPVGTDSVTASYSGDTNFATSSSSAISVTVKAVATTLTLTANPTTSSLGQQITLTATLSPSVELGTNATGTVTFLNGSTTLGTATLSSGAATLNISSLPLGVNAITASYSGNTDFAASSASAIDVTVKAVTTTLSLSANPTTTDLGQQVTLMATLSPSVELGTNATGTVTFLSGSTTLGTATLSSGTASLNTTSLPAGTDSVTASYSGDANFTSSSSSAVSVTIIAPDFSIAINPTSLSVNQGASGSTTVTITPIGGFAQSLQLTCAGFPSNSSCTFNPASVTPNGSAAVTTTLTVATNVESAALVLHGQSQWLVLAVFLFVPGLGYWKKRTSFSRRAQHFASTLLVLGALSLCLALAACGGGGSGGGGGGSGPVTPVGTSTVTVTAASSAGGPSHSVNLTLTVGN
jgi:Bacterial Ig-like domain (group 3)/FG-GAP-like repeat